jgi:hypothetical protein
MQVSPEFDASDWTSLDLTRESGWRKAAIILDDRIKGRFLGMVERIVDVEFSGFAALALDCLLIETLQQFIEGVHETPRGKGKEYFQRFLTAASFGGEFDLNSAGKFYDQFRCGILHQAEIKGSSKVWKVGRMAQPTADGKGLIVNHQILHDKVRVAFASYLRELRRGKDQTLRDNFKKKMDFICQVQPTHP